MKSHFYYRSSWVAPVLITIGVVASWFLPVVLLASVILLLAKTVDSSAVSAALVIGGAALLLSWMNLGREAVGDWLWYSQHYTAMQEIDLHNYLGELWWGIKVDSSEPVYYAGAWLLSRATGGNVSILSVAVTVLIYSALGLAVYRLLRRVPNVSRSGLIAGIVVSLLSGITFTLTNQLVRQELAMGMLALGAVALLVSDKAFSMPSFLWLLAGVLTHNSALVPATAIVAAHVVLRSENVLRRRTMMVTVTLGFLGLGAVYRRIAPTGYEIETDGVISPAVLLMDLLLLVLFVRAGARHLAPAVHRSISLGACLLVLFIVPIADLPIPTLRMYFYVEVFRVLIIAVLAVTAVQSLSHVGVAMWLVLLAVAYFELRIVSSDFVYEGGLLSHLLSGPEFALRDLGP